MNQPQTKAPEKQLPTAEVSASTRSALRTRSGSFKYYIHDSIEGYRLQLLGEMDEADVAELDGCWRTARTTIGNRKLVLDLAGLTACDGAGKRWLISMASEGASYLPDSFLRNGVNGQFATEPFKLKSARKPGLKTKVLSMLKGVAAETTQAQ